MIYTSQYSSPVGMITLAEENGFLLMCRIEGQHSCTYDHCGKTTNLLTETLAKASDWLDRYFAGENPPARELRLNPCGSEFRRTVWEILLEIPYGNTETYGAVAREAARRESKIHMSAQAVGGAVGHNPISIVIPCHRVIGADGNLTGYAGGLDKKILLLAHEGVSLSGMTLPSPRESR